MGTEQGGEHLIEPMEYIRRMRLCLFELGYRDADIQWTGQWSNQGLPHIVIRFEDAPTAVVFQASRLVTIKDYPGLPSPCYGCFQEAHRQQDVTVMIRCRDGDCVSGGPRWPPREELIGVAAEV